MEIGHLRASDKPTRCAYCHAAVDSPVVCDGCGTRLHAECRASLSGCPTLGCGQPTASPIPSDAARASVKPSLSTPVCVSCQQDLGTRSWRCPACRQSVHHACRSRPGHRCESPYSRALRRWTAFTTVALLPIAALVALALHFGKRSLEVAVSVASLALTLWLPLVGLVLFRKLRYEWLPRRCPSCGRTARHPGRTVGFAEGAMLGWDAEYRCASCEHAWKEGDGDSDQP